MTEPLYCDRCKRAFDGPHAEKRYRSHVSICSVGSITIPQSVAALDYTINDKGILSIPCGLCKADMPLTRSQPDAINLIKVTWLARRNGDAVYTGKANMSGFLEDVSYAGRSEPKYYKATGTMQICKTCYAPFLSHPGCTLDLDSATDFRDKTAATDPMLMATVRISQ